MNKKENALIIFARKPEAGKVKTRLAKTIGNEKTLQIYIKLLQHTRAVVKQMPCDSFVFLTEPTNDNFWEGFFCEQQQGDTLGDKMKNAFEMLFHNGYEQCIIIGSDCPSLEKEIVEEAFLCLLENDVTIGPAKDGGYYLLGMKKLINPLFQNKDWSTENVFTQTMEDIETLQLTYKLLPILNDVDEEKDVPINWWQELD